MKLKKISNLLLFIIFNFCNIWKKNSNFFLSLIEKVGTSKLLKISVLSILSIELLNIL